MRVRKQPFYNMVTHQKAKFGLPDILSIVMEQCDISMVEPETDKVLGSSKLFLVIVLLRDGTYVSTKPLLDQDYAAYIAATLAERCERWEKGS